MFGVLNINKPLGWSSLSVVKRVQWLVQPARAGHAGTLDPLATGVLVVAVGQATRLLQYAQTFSKEYRASFFLGRRSETEDLESEVEIIAGAHAPSVADIRAVLAASFTGEILQRPSRHSAVKVAGLRAYDLARDGVDFELPPRPVVIHRTEIVSYDYPELVLDVECGSGTYIRALGRDLAAALGTVAVMASLERTRVGKFSIESAATFDELRAGIDAHVQPAAMLVESIVSVTVTAEEIGELRQGRPIAARAVRFNVTGELKAPSGDDIAAMDGEGKLVAIVGAHKPGMLCPVKNFPQTA